MNGFEDLTINDVDIGPIYQNVPLLGVYTQARLLLPRLRHVADKNPDAIAIVFEESHLTYGELNQQANQLAHYLIEERGVTPDTLVGLCVERSLEMVVGIMGILKAGGAYVPIDPSYPAARLAHILARRRPSRPVGCRTQKN